MSSAKRFLKEKHQRRAETYLEYAETNLKDIRKLLEQYRVGDQEEIFKAIMSFLDNAKNSDSLKLELPPMGMGLLSSLLQNCSFYLGNMQQARKLQET